MKKFQESFFSLLMNPNQKNELSDLLIPAGKLRADEVMWVYYNDYHIRLQSVLNEHFVSVWKILGDDLFFEVGKKYIQTHPSPFYDLGLYGEKFSDYLRDQEVSEEFPFLPELADIEYHFQDFFHAAVPEAIAPELLTQIQTNSDLGLKLSPLLRPYQSSHPLLEIWDLPNHDSKNLNEIEWLDNHFVLYKNKSEKIKTHLLRPAQLALLELLKTHPFLKAMELGTEHFSAGEENLVSELFQFLNTEGLIIGLKSY